MKLKWWLRTHYNPSWGCRPRLRRCSWHFQTLFPCTANHWVFEKSWCFSYLRQRIQFGSKLFAALQALQFYVHAQHWCKCLVFCHTSYGRSCLVHMKKWTAAKKSMDSRMNGSCTHALYARQHARSASWPRNCHCKIIRNASCWKSWRLFLPRVIKWTQPAAFAVIGATAKSANK